MKLRPDLDISILKEYGFEEITEEYNSKHNYKLEYFKGYAYNLGHSRGGQFYYLICNFDKVFSIYASEPDGFGSDVKIDNIFFKLINDNIILP